MEQDKFNNYARARNGEYLGSFFEKYRYYRFRCDQQHIFKARGSIIKVNGWCPECAKVNRKRQLIERNKQGTLYPTDFSTIRDELMTKHNIELLTNKVGYVAKDMVEVQTSDGTIYKKRLADVYRFGAGGKAKRKHILATSLNSSIEEKCKEKGWIFLKIENSRVFYRHNNIIKSKQVIYFKKNKHLNNSRISNPQYKIIRYINSLGVQVEEGKRIFLTEAQEHRFNWYFKHFGNIRQRKRYCELDIYIPSLNLAIEYHGTIFHDAFGNEGAKHRRLPKFKYDICKELGIRLIQIAEHDWRFKQQQILDYLKNIIQPTLHRVYARKCTISDISNDVVNDFYDRYHLKGKCYSLKQNIGLFYENELVMALTVGAEGRGNSTSYSVTRMCVKPGIVVIGGLSRLTKHIKMQYTKLSTLIDLMTFTGDGWLSAGWIVDKNNPPNYVYVDLKTRKKIDKQRFSKVKNEFAFVKELKQYAQVWDCGKLRLILE